MLYNKLKPLMALMSKSLLPLLMLGTLGLSACATAGGVQGPLPERCQIPTPPDPKHLTVGKLAGFSVAQQSALVICANRIEFARTTIHDMNEAND